MKILRDRQVAEMMEILRESRTLLDASQMVMEQKDAILHEALGNIVHLQDALLTEKRCHAVTAAASSQAISEGIDLREELDALAVSLQADVARLEEWFVHGDS